VSEFEAISLKEFLLVKYLERFFYLFGWRFAIDWYAPYSPGALRGFWVDRMDEEQEGRVDFSLHWFRIARWPHSEKRWVAWRARFKEAPDT